MKKIFLSLVLMLLVFIFIEYNKSKSILISNDTNNYNKQVKKSFEISSRLKDILNQESDETKNYGGKYIDSNGKLVINFNNSNSLEIFKYIFDSNNNEEDVIFNLVNKSLEELNLIKENIWNKYSDSLVSGIAISEEQNKILTVFDSNEKLEKFKAEIDEDEIINYIFEVTEKPEFTSVTINSASPGEKIYYKVMLGKTYASVFLNAYSLDSYYMGAITCAHFAKKDRKYYNNEGTLMSTEVETRQLGGDIDAAFLPFDPENVYTFDKYMTFKKDDEIYSQSLDRLIKEEEILEGLYVKQYSEMNGYKIFRISSSSYSVKIEGYSFENVIRYKGSNNVEGGDSGTAVWFDDYSFDSTIVVAMAFAKDGDYGCGIRPRIIMEKLNVVPFLMNNN